MAVKKRPGEGGGDHIGSAARCESAAMLSESERTGEDAGLGLGDCASAIAGSNNNARRVVMKIIRLCFIAVSLNRSGPFSIYWGEGDGTPPLCMASKIESFTMFRLFHASSVALTTPEPFSRRSRRAVTELPVKAASCSARECLKTSWRTFRDFC